MICPQCHSAAFRVTDSRPDDGGSTTRRHRCCKDCGYKVTTWEVPQTLSQMRRSLRETSAALNAALDALSTTQDTIRKMETLAPRSES